MVQGTRTAGSIPVWGQAEQSAGNQEQVKTASQDEPFSFGDLIDIINPLQHIPIVSHFYQKITGDTIRPSGQIIGGTLFGGPAGFAGSLVNVIAEHETGRDITGNAIRLFAEGKAPDMVRGQPTMLASADTDFYIPDEKSSAPSTDLPAALLAFTAPSYAVPSFDVETGIGAGGDSWANEKRPVWERD